MIRPAKAQSTGSWAASSVPEPPTQASAAGETTQAEEALRRYFAAHVLSARSPRAWYLRIFPGVVRQSAIYGRHAARVSGRSFTAVLLDCLRTCVEQVYWPAGYYRFKLYLPERATLARRFLSSRLLKPLLLAANDGKEMLILDDKVRFADACRMAGLPHVNTVALFENGRAVGGPLETSLPRANLFVKSTNLLCGRGAERWVFDARSETYRSEARQLTAEQLVQHVATLSAEGVTLPLWKRLAARIPRLMVQGERALQEPRPHVIQRELRNHPQVERFSNGALCTVRIVTARSVAGPPEIITAALRMATGSSHVDNFAAGGLAAPIELHTGVLGRAVYKDIRKADVDTHPDSGARIIGERLPFWAEARSLALKVHEAFPKSAAIGWDIALTDQGPLLLEANPSWCAEVVQMAHGAPLGATALPKLLLSHLEQSDRVTGEAAPAP